MGSGRIAAVVACICAVLVATLAAPCCLAQDTADTAAPETASAAPPPGCPYVLDPSLRPPTDFRAEDVPCDDGSALLLVWEPSPDDGAPRQVRARELEVLPEYKFMTRELKADVNKPWRQAQKHSDSGYVILRKTTSDPDFLWEPPMVEPPEGKQSASPDEGYCAPVQLAAGSREYKDTDFVYILPLGEDSELRGSEPLSLEVVKWLREQRVKRDPRRNLYDYEIRYFVGNRMSPPATIQSVRPVSNAFNTRWLNVLVLVALASTFILGSIASARRGRGLYVRPIAGLQAVDDAVGRATEMGRPILFCTGFGAVDSIPTIAAMVILGRIARIAAEHGTDLIVPCLDPVVMAACREVVREAYLAAGRPEGYREEKIFYLTSQQFAYASGVVGIMTREKTATNFYMGSYFAESLILTESGSIAGAIQIVGSDSFTQLPFFVTTCDYTLMGEEFYGASAYLSREPKLLGSLKGQDLSKLVIATVMAAAVIVVTAFAFAGQLGVAEWVKETFFHYVEAT